MCVRFLVLLALEGLVVSLWSPLGAQALVILSQTSRLRAAVYGSPGFAPPPTVFGSSGFPLAASGSPLAFLSLSPDV